MPENIQSLHKCKDKFSESKYNILQQWVAYETPTEILQLHEIDKDYFIETYGSGVFDYFMGVISGEVQIGNCPVMQDFLAYLKNREISADELFELCSHFRRSMIDFSYDAKINSKEVFDSISYIFDQNFRGILKYYTDVIFQKLVDARQEALVASQAKEYFLSNMSHEIRTPLNAVLGFVNLLLEDELPKKHRNYLDIILNSGENLLSIINDILDFSKLRSGEFHIEPKVFFLHDEISHTMELFVASAKMKNITITSFIDPKIPLQLEGDILRIKQILSNFLSNAIKFTPVDGHIHIEANCRDKVLKISVEDNGIGISQEDKENIFLAFGQAQFAKESRSDGTGLGLSISCQLAELMGGDVGVESEMDEGSRFWMEIPVDIHTDQHLFFEEVEKLKNFKIAVYAKNYSLNYKHKSFINYAEVFNMDIAIVNSLDLEYDICIFLHEELISEEMSKIIKSDKKFISIVSQECDIYDNYMHVNTISFPLYCEKLKVAFEELLYPQEYLEHRKKISKHFKGKILVAEDNEANQELIKIILSKYGLEFDIVNNGLDAIELYKINHYDLILMDEQMPKMDGTQAVEKIREFEKENSLEHTPISALTANVLKGAREKGLLHGYDAFLGKPIVLKDLENLFDTFLEPDYTHLSSETSNRVPDVKIVGLDSKALTKELMLSIDELTMLLDLFVSKMQQVLPELQEAIKDKDFYTIAKKAHNIKGSSGNFRIEFLQKTASEMEEMAKKEDASYDYEENFIKIKEAIEAIKIL
ncbi:hybrid sensor histidine kinase/response regulator [Sulfurimonas marina]|uniref:histidine kinase n=1 Tax=Sulfurimonas marina TaxID=2590551 RepID=A0A7M1ATU4_9BACT|nr:hybrid sensor histidine kinase/response regulator [Sulfurimonas marina]QOP40845.1 response regulator [Sulfurimonas marina]